MTGSACPPSTERCGRWTRLKSAFAHPVTQRRSIRCFHQRAAALVERSERLVAWHSGDQVVEVPLALGFLGLLDLEQIHVVHHAAVDADLAILGEEVVDRSG